LLIAFRKYSLYEHVFISKLPYVSYIHAWIVYRCIHINNLLGLILRKQETVLLLSRAFEGQGLFARVIAAAGIGKGFLCETLYYNGCALLRFSGSLFSSTRFPCGFFAPAKPSFVKPPTLPYLSCVAHRLTPAYQVLESRGRRRNCSETARKGGGFKVFKVSGKESETRY